MTCNKCGREMVLLSAEVSRENSSSLYYCENIGCPDWKTVKADIFTGKWRVHNPENHKRRINGHNTTICKKGT
jgi:hypothetical protein